MTVRCKCISNLALLTLRPAPSPVLLQHDHIDPINMDLHEERMEDEIPSTGLTESIVSLDNLDFLTNASTSGNGLGDQETHCDNCDDDSEDVEDPNARDPRYLEDNTESTIMQMDVIDLEELSRIACVQDLKLTMDFI